MSKKKTVSGLFPEKGRESCPQERKRNLNVVYQTVIRWRGWSCQLLLTALLVATSAFWNTLHAGEPLSAYADSQGRVVFTNEPLPDSSLDRVSPGSEPSLTGSLTAQTRIHELIEGIAGQHGMDPDLIRAIVQVESNFDPNAVSPRGAMGLMQLIPETAKRFGVRNAFDPKANLDGGIRYLKYLVDLFDGDLRLALAAYNAGENMVTRRRAIPSIPETQNYVRKISQLYPLNRLRRVAVSTIEKMVDSKGIVHFSNTELP